MNACKTQKDARYHKIMVRVDACHLKTLELEHRRITSTDETSRSYIAA